MKKGQSIESRIKNILKFFKMNENTISTVMGGVVVLVIVGLIFNYFRTTNLKTWQNLLNGDGAQTSEEDKTDDSVIATYKVQKGDDLWHIAEKYYKSGYNYVDIIKANKLDENGTIEIGMELKIPKAESKKITVVEEKVAEKKDETIKPEVTKAEEKKETIAVKGDTKAIEAGEYVTVRGDTYWKIAVRAYGDGYAWTKIYEANKKIFGNPNLIHADVKIVIPSLK